MLEVVVTDYAEFMVFQRLESKSTSTYLWNPTLCRISMADDFATVPQYIRYIPSSKSNIFTTHQMDFGSFPKQPTVWFVLIPKGKAEGVSHTQ